MLRALIVPEVGPCNQQESSCHLDSCDPKLKQDYGALCIDNQSSMGFGQKLVHNAPSGKFAMAMENPRVQQEIHSQLEYSSL